MKIATRFEVAALADTDTDTVLCFDEFALDLARRRLLCGEREVELRPKSFDVLACLATHAGRVMTKDELLVSVWPGVVVTDESLSRCVSDIRAALGDAGQKLVKTVPRRGYLFAMPAVSGMGAPMPARRSGRWAWAVALALVLLCVLGGVLWWVTDSRQANPALTIAVMPLGSRNGDSQQDYLAEAVTEEITVDLSRIPGAFVIGRSTADSYRGRQADARRVGRELGVHYVLEGGLDRIGDNVRLSLQLVDATSGGTLWAERFDGELRDLAALHRRVTGIVAQSLHIRLLEAESDQAQRRPAADLKAQDLALRAWALLRRGPMAPNIADARELLQQAVARDPQSAFAWALLAQTYIDDVSGRTSNADQAAATRAEWLRRGEQAAERAYSLDPNHPNALAVRGWILAKQGRGEEALPFIQRHLQIDRNNATAWHSQCYTFATLGRQEESIRACQEAMRLSPRDANLYGFYIVTAASHLYLGHDAEALAWARKSAAVQPKFSVPHAWAAAAAANLGDVETAQAALAEFRRLRPDYTITSFRDEKLCANALCEQQRQRFYSGLRIAGLAE
jgi:TolB-like protein/DNA-binding winged helix-turn-helix (wHTH) protein/Tfp pilus assembly protein PilF